MAGRSGACGGRGSFRVAANQFGRLAPARFFRFPFGPAVHWEISAAPLEKGKDVGIIAFIILGLLAGGIAKWLMPGDDPGGWIVTAIIGVAGALLGGFLAGALFDADPMDEFFDISTWLTAIVGSIILLVIYRLVVDRRGGRALRT
jgi:uncharacterized membrane protein YeaQ/YmgE (transglycosylase-associated protein family)